MGAAVDAALMAIVLANASIPVVTTASNTAIVNADLASPFYTLDATYRGSDSVTLIVSKNTAKAIRAIVDTNGRPLVEDSQMVLTQTGGSLFGDDTLTRGMLVARFRGIPILESPNVADITASGIVGVVASWADAFTVRVVDGSVGVARLTERCADTYETAFNGLRALRWCRDQLQGGCNCADALTMARVISGAHGGARMSGGLRSVNVGRSVAKREGAPMVQGKPKVISGNGPGWAPQPPSGLSGVPGNVTG
jgi:hypothetical protein